jgi:ribosomal protein L29
MAVLKFKDIEKLGKQDKEEKLKELRFELIKKNVTANKASKTKAKEIKKAIARLLTSLSITQKNTQKK